ncbi:MAG TPA: hypothetical protein DET40_07850 [Lentisphaeria bacterium]|nr:MAG: hypothetical protein A2X45_11825 [Lentisphaerae bacterium GWF2_50_93]HCE43447.1 hypothetical protein [Lentisphaeria bacterium]
MKSVRILKIFNKFVNLSLSVCVSLVIFSALFSLLLADEVKTESGKTGSERKTEVKKATAAEEEAGPAAELEAVRRENEMLRKELADVLLKSDEIFDTYRRLQLSVAATMANSEKKNVGEGELKSLESFIDVRQELKALVAKTLELFQFTGTALENNELTDTDKVRLKRKIEDLKTEAEKLNALLSPPESKERTDRCRILSVNDKLQVILLDAGTANGVNTGLQWKVSLKSGKPVKVKVIASRPFISAAVVIEGDFSSLAPGMLAAVGDK